MAACSSAVLECDADEFVEDRGSFPGRAVAVGEGGDAAGRVHGRVPAGGCEVNRGGRGPHQRAVARCSLVDLEMNGGGEPADRARNSPEWPWRPAASWWWQTAAAAAPTPGTDGPVTATTSPGCASCRAAPAPQPLDQMPHHAQIRRQREQGQPEHEVHHQPRQQQASALPARLHAATTRSTNPGGYTPRLLYRVKRLGRDSRSSRWRLGLNARGS